MRKTRIIVFLTILFLLFFSGICFADVMAQTDVLTVKKTASPRSFSEVGEQIVYTYEISADRYVFDLSVNDDVIGKIDCPDSINAKTITCTATYTITEEDILNGSVSNEVTVSGSYENESSCCGGYSLSPSTSSVSASANTTITTTLLPEISLEKTASPTTYTAAGQEISYSYTVVNIGKIPISGPVTLEDDRADPVICPSGDIEVGASITCTATYTITEEDLNTSSIINHATATAGDATAEASAEIFLEPANPALTLLKTAAPTVFTKAGDLVKFSFVVTNTGDVPLNLPISIDDSLELSDFVCDTFDSLVPGDSFGCSGWYVTRSTDVNNTVTNCATASGTFTRLTDIQFYTYNVISNESCVDVFYQAPAEKPEPEPEPPQS